MEYPRPDAALVGIRRRGLNGRWGRCATAGGMVFDASRAGRGGGRGRRGWRRAAGRKKIAGAGHVEGDFARTTGRCGRRWRARRPGAAAQPVVDQVAPECGCRTASRPAEWRGGAAGLAVGGLAEDVEQAHAHRRRPVAPDERDNLADQAIAGRIGDHPGDLAIVVFGLAGAHVRRQDARHPLGGAERLGGRNRREGARRGQWIALRIGHASGGPDGQAQGADEFMGQWCVRPVETGEQAFKCIVQRFGDRANRRDAVVGGPRAAPEQVGFRGFGGENILERGEAAESTDRQRAPECRPGTGRQVGGGQRGVFKRGDGQQAEGIRIAAGRAFDQGADA